MSTPDANSVNEALTYIGGLTSIMEKSGVEVSSSMKKGSKVYLMSLHELRRLHAETPPPALFYHVWEELKKIDEAFETFCISDYIERCNYSLQLFTSKANALTIA